MGKVVEKKKKKGRPSLLDLQKRSLREHQLLLQQQQHQKKIPNPNYKPTPASSATLSRRSTRWNPNSEGISQSETDNIDTGGEEDDELNSKRKEKKLKLVLKLPPQLNNSTSQNSNGSDSNDEDDNHKKRKINAIRDGSGLEKGEKSISGTNPTNPHQGSQVDAGPSTPLPDKKLLLFVLDRLQKKDIYGVFSEPVDPNELPDYREVISNPMDFGTVRKKLASAAYTNLEQLEKDIFLICSNAMQYNAPDTIYFRQAKSIQELAKKNFENLRQDGDEHKAEPKIVRRGRPPTKNLKKPLGRPPLDRTGSELSEATLATGGDNIWSNYDLRKGSGLAEVSGRSHGFRNGEMHTGWSADHKYNDEFPGSMLRGTSTRYGKKQFVPDENRRNTYNPSGGMQESSVLTTFDGEKKLLMPVGLHSEHGYARSLARFATNLGSVAWKIAAKKIERSLLPGIKFGPGWVGENDNTLPRPVLQSSPLPGQQLQSQPLSTPLGQQLQSEPLSTPPGQQLPSQPFATPPDQQLPSQPFFTRGQQLPSQPLSTPPGQQLPSQPLFTPPGQQLPSQPFSTPGTSSAPALGTSFSAPTPSNVESKGDKPEVDTSLEEHVPSSKPLPPPAPNKSLEPSTESAEAIKGLNFSSVSAARPRPPFQIQQNPVFHSGMNGFNTGHGLNLAAQMGKLVQTDRPAGFNFQSPGVDASSLKSEDAKVSEKCEGLTPPNPGIHTPQQKPDLVPPDLNVKFHSPGSPSTSRVDSTQPDLALQL